MKKRCYNQSDKAYKYYGARGIKICDEWLLGGSKAFVKWALENGYQDNLTIDRINNNGNYEPSNCRWIDKKTQANNTRRNKRITINGKTKTISQWADYTNINYGTLKARARKNQSEDFLNPNRILRKSQKQKIAQWDYDGNLIKIWDNLSSIHKELGYDMSTIFRLCKRIIKEQCYTAYKSGWTFYPQEQEWHYPNIKGGNKHFLTIDGETHCKKEWAELYGITTGIINYRLSKGITGTDLLKPRERTKSKKK